VGQRPGVNDQANQNLWRFMNLPVGVSASFHWYNSAKLPQRQLQIVVQNLTIQEPFQLQPQNKMVLHSHGISGPRIMLQIFPLREVIPEEKMSRRQYPTKTTLMKQCLPRVKFKTWPTIVLIRR